MPTLDPSIELALTLKASSDPMRLQILRLLKRDSFTASELALLLGIKQSALSHHLKIMTQAAWLNTRREGNTLFYRRHIHAQPSVAQVQQSILRCLDMAALDEGANTTLAAVRHARQQIGAAFFESHAHELDSVTDRIAGYRHYSDAIQEALKRSPHSQQQSALEIGPGDGGFLPFLSEHFTRVYALDIAQPMLDLAKEQVQTLANIEFIHGDINTALQAGIQADFVALNMVLHHIASPADFLAQCWQLLNPNGQLLITDLCAHQQDWVRAACGDFWMGFAPDELLGWAHELGFVTQEPLLVGLKNGFQVQIHILKKQFIALV
ncbi:MAG: metalloregulator ArsR/SmtB family transcription factor [Bermanella sp.]